MTHVATDMSAAKSARRARPLPWAAIAVGAYLAVVGATILLSAHLGRPVTLCLFKRVTHLPCPTCGTSRAVLTLLHGHVVRAWLCNPLVITAGLVAAVVLAVRAATGRWAKLALPARARPWLWVLLAVAVAANWAWLIAAGR